jgi:hypothetical protein
MWYRSHIRWSILALNASIGGKFAEIVSVAHTSVVVIRSSGNPLE